MAVAPRLGTNVSSGSEGTTMITMPHVAAADGYTETVGYRGGLRRMASGVVVADLVASGLKRRFRLTWPALTDAQKTTVENALAFVDDSSAQFRAPTNTVYTVTRDPDAGDIELASFMIGGGALRWRCTLSLVEV